MYGSDAPGCDSAGPGGGSGGPGGGSETVFGTDSVRNNVSESCARLFGDYLGVVWEVFCEDFEGKTIQRETQKLVKLYFLLFKTGPLSRFTMLRAN